MPEEFRPRENDHLVEPIFEALRESPDEDDPRPRRRRGWLPALLLLVIVSLLWALLVG